MHMTAERRPPNPYGENERVELPFSTMKGTCALNVHLLCEEEIQIDLTVTLKKGGEVARIQDG